MPANTANLNQTRVTGHKQSAAKSAAKRPAALTQQTNVSRLQRVVTDPHLTQPAAVLPLQRLVGSRAVSCSIQTKLTVGPAGDRYEQEAIGWPRK